ncbi:DDE Tnp4 domain-containing protein [Citrus sinensis]|nr:DDE Tnp4 domain-containing protein [Citrus sinensis]
MANPKVEKFRKEGIDKELEGKLDMIFMNITATSNKAWTPSCGEIPLDDYEDSNNDTIFPIEENNDFDKDIHVQCTYQGAKEKKDEKVVGLHSTQAKTIKEKKLIMEGGRFESSTLINLEKEMNDYSVTEAMKTVEFIPGVEIGGNIRLFATQLLIRFVYNMDMLDNEQEFDSIISTFMITIDYYYRTYIHKQPCMNSSETGNVWLIRILKGNETQCISKLCNELEINYRLKGSRRVSATEVLGMFLHTIGHDTMSRYFGEALDTICCLSVDLIKSFDPEFKDIPKEILRDSRYMPHFKDCICAIDSTHVHVSTPPEDQIPCIGRKGIPTQNIMVARNFDMHSRDTRTFLSTLCERYHLLDFRRGNQPTGYQEVFNHAHFSLRSVIERTFGVWKKNDGRF